MLNHEQEFNVVDGKNADKNIFSFLSVYILHFKICKICMCLLLTCTQYVAFFVIFIESFECYQDYAFEIKSKRNIKADFERYYKHSPYKLC